MFKTKALAWTGGLLILLGTFGACNNKKAPTAYLDLNTRILIHESTLGGGKNLTVSVVDKRRHLVLMKKDSYRKIRSGRALVSKDYHPSLQLDATFQEIATEAFQLQGYKTDGKGTGTSRELTIYITFASRSKRRLASEPAPKEEFRNLIATARSSPMRSAR